MSPYLRHRNLVYLPFVLLFVATVIGGWYNTIDLRGHVLDDFSGDGVKDATLALGQRSVTTDQSGAFEFQNLPKTGRITVDRPGYFRQTIPATQEEIRLSPNSITVVVKEQGAASDTPIEGAEVRQGTTVLGTTLSGGSTVISPHPGRDAQVLVCAKNHQSKTVTLRGTQQTVELEVGTEGCPPLPSPSPSPSASPSGSGSPEPSASPSPTPSASPEARATRAPRALKRGPSRIPPPRRRATSADRARRCAPHRAR